jgi:PPOX class probable F420-dependent enzyme
MADLLVPRESLRVVVVYVTSGQRTKGRPMAAELSDKVKQALEGKYFWALATINPDGTPQNTIVWVDRDGDLIKVNTALGRKKPRNLEQNPNVALTWYDPESPYAPISIQGRVVDSYTGERAEADIDSLARVYLDKDVYPFRQEGEQRITYLIEPLRVHAR